MSVPGNLRTHKSVRVNIRFTPLKPQAGFLYSHEALRAFIGGIGTGKTHTGAAAAIRAALLNSNCDGMIVAPTTPLLKRVTLRRFAAMLPDILVKEHLRGERCYVLKNQARVYYASADRPDSLEASELAWAWGDEARYWRKESWDILQGRVRDPRARSLQLFVTSTPSQNWLYDTFAKEEAVTHMATWENPYLSPDFHKALKTRYSAELYRRYCGGEWGADESATFPEFSRSRLVQPHLYRPDKPVVASFDPGYIRSAVLFLQYHEYCRKHEAPDCMHVVGELMPEKMDTLVVTEAIKRRVALTNYKLSKIITDPAAAAHSVQVGYSDIDILESAGFECDYTTDPRKRYIPYGVSLLRGKMSPVEGSPSLYFDETLQEEGGRGILRALEKTTYPKKKQDDKPIKDGTYDHALDALRYAAVVLCSAPEQEVWV